MAQESKHAGCPCALRLFPHFGRLSCDIKTCEVDSCVERNPKARKVVGGSRPKPQELGTTVLTAESLDTIAVVLEILGFCTAIFTALTCAPKGTLKIFCEFHTWLQALWVTYRFYNELQPSTKNFRIPDLPHGHRTDPNSHPHPNSFAHQYQEVLAFEDIHLNKGCRKCYFRKHILSTHCQLTSSHRLRFY